VISIRYLALLLLVVVLIAGCSEPLDNRIGVTDNHGCFVTEGEEWCESLNKCIKLEKQECPAVKDDK